MRNQSCIQHSSAKSSSFYSPSNSTSLQDIIASFTSPDVCLSTPRESTSYDYSLINRSASTSIRILLAGPVDRNSFTFNHKFESFRAARTVKMCHVKCIYYPMCNHAGFNYYEYCEVSKEPRGCILGWNNLRDRMQWDIESDDKTRKCPSCLENKLNRMTFSTVMESLNYPESYTQLSGMSPPKIVEDIKRIASDRKKERELDKRAEHTEKEILKKYFPSMHDQY